MTEHVGTPADRLAARLHRESLIESLQAQVSRLTQENADLRAAGTRAEGLLRAAEMLEENSRGASMSTFYLKDAEAEESRKFARAYAGLAQTLRGEAESGAHDNEHAYMTRLAVAFGFESVPDEEVVE